TKVVDQLLFQREMTILGHPLPPKKRKRKKWRKDASVFPDVIVHRRVTPDNYLVIETKKSTSHVPHAYDHAKLQLFTRDFDPEPFNLHYSFGLFLVLRAGEEVATKGLRADLLWFSEGAPLDTEENRSIEGKFDPKKWAKQLG